MHLYKSILLICFAVSAALPQYRDKVTDAKQLAGREALREAFRVDSCCESSLAECLRNKPECTLAPRLDNMLSWMVMLGRDSSKIVTELKKRHDFFYSTGTYPIDITVYEPAGEPSAPVIIAIYVSASCPMCKRVIMGVFKEITQGGSLAGKAILAPIPFGTRIGDQALLAAKQFGKFWEFFAALEQIKTRLDEKVLVHVAQGIGISPAQFKPLLYDQSLTSALLKSREEAERNGVTVTPTAFINGRRYHSYKDPEWIVDAAEYEYEKITRAAKK